MQVKCGPLNWGYRNHHIPLFGMSFLWGIGCTLQRPWIHRSPQLFVIQNWTGFIYRIWRLCLWWSGFHYTHIWNSLSRSWRFIACHLLGQGSGKCLPHYSLRWTLETETLYILQGKQTLFSNMQQSSVEAARVRLFKISSESSKSARSTSWHSRCSDEFKSIT